jgi:hypothetical protein
MAKSETEYHNLHCRIEMPIWKRLRYTFPEYGALKTVINRALEDFLDKWEDIDVYLVRCERLKKRRDAEKTLAQIKES